MKRRNTHVPEICTIMGNMYYKYQKVIIPASGAGDIDRERRIGVGAGTNARDMAHASSAAAADTSWDVPLPQKAVGQVNRCTNKRKIEGQVRRTTSVHAVHMFVRCIRARGKWRFVSVLRL
jgi:hypothetical protein